MPFMNASWLSLVTWLLTGACGAIFIVKFRGTQTAVLGGIGFGAFLFGPLAIQMLMPFNVHWWEFSWVFDLLRIGGWTLLLLAILKLPAAAGSPTPVQNVGGGSPHNVYTQANLSAANPAWSYQQSPVRRSPFLSKGLFIGSFLAGAGASIFFSSIAMVFIADHDEEIGLPFLILAFLALAYAAVMVGILVYRLWESIQPGRPRTTPGKAVGFLFIPLFNLYWIFQAYYGWAQDYNRYVQGAGLPAPPVSENIGLTVSILAVASCIPYVGILPGLVNLIFLAIFFSQTIDGANALVGARMAQSQPEQV